MAQSSAATGTPAARKRGRTIAAVLLIVLGAILAPVGVVAGWGRATLTDTDAFVATYAPLVSSPEVQDVVIDQVTTTIVDRIGLERATSEIIDRLSPGPVVRRSLEALQGPIVRGLADTIESVVGRFVRSDAFAAAWTASLRVSHAQLNATLSEDPGALVSAQNGVIGLQLGPIVAAARQALIDQGFTLAERIPAVDRTIPITTSEAIPTVRGWYRAVLAVGAWAGLLAIALLVAGVLVAPRRGVAVAGAALGVGAALAVLLLVLAWARSWLVSSVPGVVTPEAATLVYDTATLAVRDTAKIVMMVGFTLGVVAWLSGPTSFARGIRGAYLEGVARLRAWAESRGITTGRLGERVHALRRWIFAGLWLVGVLVVLFVRPLTGSVLVWTALAGLLAAIVVTLVERPGPSA